MCGWDGMDAASTRLGPVPYFASFFASRSAKGANTATSEMEAMHASNKKAPTHHHVCLAARSPGRPSTQDG